MSNEAKYDQPSAAPTPKMTAVGMAGVIVTLVIGLANLFGIVIPEEVTGAALTVVSGLVTVITFVAGYMKRDKKPVEAIPIITESKYTDSLKG